MDNITDVLPAVAQKTTNGLGKFSVYFVMFATSFALAIFAYALVRLFKQCRDKRRMMYYESLNGKGQFDNE